MAVQLIQVSQKFYNEFKNDIGFVSNLGDFTFNLAGHVMENLKYVQEVDVSWRLNASNANLWQITHESGALFYFEQNLDWKNEGFSVGDDIAWYYEPPGGPTTTTGTVTSLSGGVMVAQMNSVPPEFTTPGTSLPSGGSIMYGATELTACKYRFGLLSNTESFNVESKVSLNDQGWYSGTVGLGGPRDTTFQDMIKLGQYNDWITGSMRIRYVSNPSTYVQRFEIEHSFTVVPYYLDGELPNLQGNIIPELLAGDNSLKYAYTPGFRNVLSDPNSEKSIVVDDNLGSVAWFNENFNGFQNIYNVSSVAYEEAVGAAVIDGISVGVRTKITIRIENTDTAYTGGERFGVYISYLPSQAEYQDTLTTLKTNFIYDRAITNEGVAPVAGDDFIQSVEATVDSGDLLIEIETEYSPTQQQFLASKLNDGEGNYLIGVQVGDDALPSGSSDRVLLLADARAYSGSPDIEGLMNVTQMDFFTHGEVEGVDLPTSNAVVWNEEGFYVNYDLELNLNQQAVLNTLDFKLVAYNSVQQRFFEMDSFSFNPGQAIISSGVQQINETLTRGYILNTGDPFNDATIAVDANVAGVQHYVGRFAQKVSWQEWQRNLNVDNVFYDVAEPEFNLNRKTSNYSGLNGYTIHLMIFGNVSGVSTLGVSGTSDYWIISPAFTVYDYDEDPASNWSYTIETFDETGTTNLGGSILTDANTLFRVTWVSAGGPLANLDDIVGVNRIEAFEQPGDEITEMSSVNLPASDQILIPSAGDKLDMQLVSGDVVMECLIDYTKISSNQQYCLSSQIRDNNAVVVDGKATETDVLKETEQGVIKIIE